MDRLSAATMSPRLKRRNREYLRGSDGEEMLLFDARWTAHFPSRRSDGPLVSPYNCQSLQLSAATIASSNHFAALEPGKPRLQGYLAHKKQRPPRTLQ